MIASSGQYNYQSLTAESIIREAYELVGIPASLLVAEQLDSAMRSINFLLSSWVVRNINLWTLKENFLPLIPGVKEYTLPIYTLKVIQAELRSSTRRLGGVAKSNTLETYDGLGVGTAASAFDDNFSTYCTQNVVNGNISYDLGNALSVEKGLPYSQIINFVGILSADNISTFNIVIEVCSGDPTVKDNWKILKTLDPIIFTKDTIWWTNLNNINSYRYYRIRETGGSTLNIAEIYFNNNITDTLLTEVSRFEYLSLPQKNIIGRPSLYACDYQVVPKLFLWQVPSSKYNCIVYSSQGSIETLTSYVESINVPLSFYAPLIYGLAEKLAMKYSPEKAEMFKNVYENELQLSVIQNTVNLPLTLRTYNND